VALDYVRAIKKTPIVVNDVRGFYCISVVLPYVTESVLMVKEGISIPLIDNCAVHMGMPVGPLTLNDEISLELGWSITKSTMAGEGENYVSNGTEDLLELFVEKIGRPGKKAGKGFYDYPESGNKSAWTGIGDHYPIAAEQPSPDDVKERLMYIQLVQAANMFAQNVVHDPQSADLGAIFGWGFAPWTGGPMSHIDTIGVQTFVETAEKLAARYGDRFAPPQMFKDLAAKGGKLYVDAA
jgi:3-hydroxyacyl-CoA dehydrogenase/enoyl-CoA hydratase/3-hydroxybutyryl-CoA epimerase